MDAWRPADGRPRNVKYAPAFGREARGWVTHASDRGWAKKDDEGRFEFTTIKPAPNSHREIPVHHVPRGHGGALLLCLHDQTEDVLHDYLHRGERDPSLHLNRNVLGDVALSPARFCDRLSPATRNARRSMLEPERGEGILFKELSVKKQQLANEATRNWRSIHALTYGAILRTRMGQGLGSV